MGRRPAPGSWTRASGLAAWLAPSASPLCPGLARAQKESVGGARSSSCRHGYPLESRGSCAAAMSSGGTGMGGSEPPGLARARAQLALAADRGPRCPSSPSDLSSEASLPEIYTARYPEEISLLQLHTKDGHRPEWTFYPRLSSGLHTYHVGKQCLFNGVFLGNRRSLAERTVDRNLGRKRYDIDPRNGIPQLTPGDKPYMFPEQSKGFHKAGSTLPPVNFSLVPYQKKFDTFVPLQPLPQVPSLPFWVKEMANNLRSEIREVEELDHWRLALPLMQSFLPPGASKNLQKTVLWTFQGSPEREKRCRTLTHPESRESCGFRQPIAAKRAAPLRQAPPRSRETHRPLSPPPAPFAPAQIA
ncbi:spermatogenesis-associated serine-rich protein 1 [Ctenodactylus gundi]